MKKTLRTQIEEIVSNNLEDIFNGNQRITEDGLNQILTLFSKSNKDLMEKVERMKMINTEEGDTNHPILSSKDIVGYNQAIDDIKDLLKEKAS